MITVFHVFDQSCDGSDYFTSDWRQALRVYRNMTKNPMCLKPRLYIEQYAGRDAYANDVVLNEDCIFALDKGEEQ